MNSRHPIAALLTMFAASVAMAHTAPSETAASPASGQHQTAAKAGASEVTRAQVRAELERAHAEGKVPLTEAKMDMLNNPG